MTTNVMIDLETLGVNPGCAIMSIGAVRFDETELLGEPFYYEISLASCRAVGLVVEKDTRNWWRGQAASLYDRTLNGDGEDLPYILTRFNSWAPTGMWNIWSNGAAFDIPILTVAYRACGFLAPPWRPFSDRCYRTLKNLRPEIKMNRVGEAHDALHDARSQALHAIELLKSLQGPPATGGGSWPASPPDVGLPSPVYSPGDHPV